MQNTLKRIKFNILNFYFIIKYNLDPYRSVKQHFY